VSPRAQILVAAIVALSIVFILRLVRRRELRGKYALLWVGVALVLGVFAMVPDVLVPISDWVGIGYEPATFFLAAFAFLFIVIVQFSWELSRLEERSRTLAEELALLRAEVGGGPAPAEPSEPAEG
jgi:hypothetical protein